MAESTLSTSYSELRTEAARILGFDRDSTGWSTTESEYLDRVLKKAMRQAYYPEIGHDWRFLTPTANFTTWLTISGTATSAVHSGGYTTITATTSVFQSSLDTSHSLVATGVGTFPFYSYTSGTVIVVTGNATGAGAFTITANDTYRAPDNFGELLDRMWFSAGQGQDRRWIEQRSIDRIEQMRSDEITGIPVFVGVEPTLNSLGQQRWNFVFYPEPDTAYTLRYRYRIQPDVITSAAPYAYGPVWFADVLIAAVRSEAEWEFMGTYGAERAAFEKRVSVAVVRDLKTGSKVLGNINSTAAHTGDVGVTWPSTTDITY